MSDWLWESVVGDDACWGAEDLVTSESLSRLSAFPLAGN